MQAFWRNGRYLVQQLRNLPHVQVLDRHIDLWWYWFKLLEYLLFTVYGAGRNNFDAGKIHYKGHWNGWDLIWQRAKRVPFGAHKIYTSGTYCANRHSKNWDRTCLAPGIKHGPWPYPAALLFPASSQYQQASRALKPLFGALTPNKVYGVFYVLVYPSIPY